MIGLLAGCSILDWDSGGCEPTPATDAAFSLVYLQCRETPCGYGEAEAPRDADPHIMVDVLCPGDSEAFLVAVKVDGRLHALLKFTEGFNSYARTLDAGSWAPADSAWHRVDVVIDPLNLFQEQDETNNTGSRQMRMLDPVPGRVPERR
jgi:hypothetical protein